MTTATSWCDDMPVICDVPSFTNFEQGFSQQINLLVAMIDAPPEYQKTQIRDPIRNFLRRVFLCPGSGDSHDAEPAGLAKHTLEVCRLTLENAKLNPELNYKDRLAAFVVALLHDITRANAVDVKDVTPRAIPGKEQGTTWVPSHESMARWAEENDVRKVSMEFVPKREVYGTSEAIACMYILRIFHESLRTLIGQQRDGAIIAALTARLRPPALDLRAYMKGADRIMAARSVLGVSHFDHVQIWETLQNRIANQARWNESPPYFLASPSHVLIPYAVNNPDSRGEAFWGDIHRLLQNADNQEHDSKKFRQVVLDILKHDLVLCSNTGDIEVDALFFVEVDGIQRASIAIPWQNVLGRNSKKPPIQNSPPPLRFYSRKAEVTLAIEPGDLGFTSADSPDAVAMIEVTHLTEIWRSLVTPPLSSPEKAITDGIIEHGRIAPRQKMAALELIRMRVAKAARA